MKRREAILDLDRGLSRLLDTLCLELSITNTDGNSAGLLEILEWRLEESVSSQQFSELYTAWAESKGITDVLATRQTEAFDKAQLLQMLPQHLLSLPKIAAAVGILNKEYISQIQGLEAQIYIIDRIFNALDVEKVGHLRRSQLLVLQEALLEVKVLWVDDRTLDEFMAQLNVLEKQMSGVAGKVSYRNFVNGIVNRQLTIKTLKDLEHYIGSLKHPLSNPFEVAMTKWKSSPRFQRKRIDRYKRVFQQHDQLFMVANPDACSIESQLESLYGKPFLMMADIDFVVIREFCDVFRGEIEVRIKQIGLYMDRKKRFALENMDTPTPKSAKSANKLSARQPVNRLKQNQHQMTTPKKLSSTMNITPKKHLPPYQLTQLRQIRKTTSAVSRGRQGQGKGQHKTISKSPLANNSKSPNKAPISGVQIIDKVSFFKNRRVESFETVMRRLRMKK